MAGTYKCTVTTFKVKDKEPHGTIVVARSGTTTPPTAPIPTGNEFKLDEDSDQSFAGMASICSHVAGTAKIILP